MLKRFFALLLARPGLTAIIAGAASATGFAPLGLWPVTLVMLALLLWLLEHAPGHRAAFALGWLFGVGHFTIGNNWIATAFTFQAKMPAWLGWLAVPLLSLYLAIFIGLATWAAWAVWQRVTAPRQPGKARRPLILALLFAAAWIVTEWMRSWVFSGFAWNPLAAVGIGVAQTTAVIGTYGQSALWVTFAAALLAAARIRLGRAVLLGLPMAAAAAWSWVEPGMTAIGESDTPFTIVQPNIGQGDKYDMQLRAENYAKLAALSPRQPEQPPRLLLWPEAAVPDYLEEGYPLEWYIEAPAFVRAQLAGLLGGADL
ncbi:MAG: apolipoprotein N-acyltransferase, partial [Sphingopyxis sp.]|nr:apolipoprotein N-acyltransferase [Sphingopyxis sp.]